jgi:S-adenosylmethionine hydrolase
MPDPLITLTTDFGEDSPYVAALKGAVLSVNPAARLLDLGHQVPPQDVRHAAFFLAASIPYFPPGVIHVVVVDPGVGSERALLCVTVGGHRLLAPDNGCWTHLARGAAAPVVIRLAEPRYWRQPVSATFHGRDILAPVAGHLSLGLDPLTLGPVVSEWVRLEERPPAGTAGELSGEVVFVDRFGNLITNLPGDAFGAPQTQPVRVAVNDQEVSRVVRTYADAPPGSLVALVSSAGLIEVAVVQGSAAERLRAGVGARVTVTFPAAPPSA